AATPGPEARDCGSHDHGEAIAGDAADALLEAAARCTIARRAGMRPAEGIAVPPPMPDDRAAELPARAWHLLRRVTSDPELLADGWSRETAEERGQLLAVLSHGLSAADEAFLEGVLDDRASWVRAAARRLLGQLPGSAFNQRAAGRARQVLRLRGDDQGRWL